MADSNDLVVLKGGVIVKLPALRLALSLEDRGFRFALLDDGRLEVQPVAALTVDDCRQIRAHRDELVQIVRYETAGVVA